MKPLLNISVILLLGLASVSDAASVYVNGFITRTMIADQGRWGGCMVMIDKSLSDLGLDCPEVSWLKEASWLSLSCSGVFTTKDIAYRMFDSAQMAYALGRPVMIQVDDTKKHNGYCYASRIDVLPAPK